MDVFSANNALLVFQMYQFFWEAIVCTAMTYICMALNFLTDMPLYIPVYTL